MLIQNPATLETIAEIAPDSDAAIAKKVEAARGAQPHWAARPLSERLAAIARFRQLLVDRKEDLARTLTSEMGKPITQARNELSAMPGRIDFFLQETEAVMREQRVYRDGTGDPPKMEEIIRHEPLGVVANISAWNYPYFVGSNVFVPALLTGNAVVYKPSEHALLTGQHIADLLRESGIPAEVFQLVHGDGAAGRALVEAQIDAIFFTGSHATGVKIAQAAAGRLIKVQLELGGKDPAYVTDDVDIQAAAEGLADGAFYNTGQSCCAVERIYVHESCVEPFTQAFVAAVRGFTIGDPRKDDTYIGPLARGEQLAELKAQVADALAKGGRLLCGGKRIAGRGHFFEPTVIADAANQMAVMRQESFGPVIGIAAVEDDAEAIARMNDSEYGLTAGVYCRDRGRAETLLAQLDAGSAYWNCCDRVSPRLPWTGRRHSGLGSTLSVYGIQAFLRPKAYHLRAPA